MLHLSSGLLLGLRRLPSCVNYALVLLMLQLLLVDCCLGSLMVDTLMRGRRLASMHAAMVMIASQL